MGIDWFAPLWHLGIWRYKIYSIIAKKTIINSVIVILNPESHCKQLPSRQIELLASFEINLKWILLRRHFSRGKMEKQNSFALGPMSSNWISNNFQYCLFDSTTFIFLDIYSTENSLTLTHTSYKVQSMITNKYHKTNVSIVTSLLVGSSILNEEDPMWLL